MLLGAFTISKIDNNGKKYIHANNDIAFKLVCKKVILIWLNGYIII